MNDVLISWVADMILATLILAALMFIFNTPTWAAFGFSYLSFLIVRQGHKLNGQRF